MIPAEGTDRVNDPVHLPQGHTIHSLIQCVEICFDFIVVHGIGFAVCLVKKAKDGIRISWIQWVRRQGGYHKSGKTQFSMCLCTDDLKNLRDDLQSQIDSFNWEGHGRIEYYEINLPEHELKPAYSAEELRADLSSLLTAKTLRKVFVALYGYIDSSQRTENSLDFSYMSGACLLVFDDLAIELCIHAEGMIRYHVFYDINPSAFVKKTGFAPEDTYSSSSYFVDIAPLLNLKYENSWVKTVEEFPADTWSFQQSWFDEAKAEASGNLPNLIKLNMSNGVRVCFEGDSIECYFMWLEQYLDKN